jgi:hypothetical protein
LDYSLCIIEKGIYSTTGEKSQPSLIKIQGLRLTVHGFGPNPAVKGKSRKNPEIRTILNGRENKYSCPLKGTSLEKSIEKNA